jgi:hypothetical protein
MTNNPITLSIILPYEINHPPIPPKNIPIQTNTKVNPAINSKVAINAFDFLIDLLAFNPNPVIKERYPGTKGSTHGDKKEINPALNEINIAIRRDPWVTEFIRQPN